MSVMMYFVAGLFGVVFRQLFGDIGIGVVEVAVETGASRAALHASGKLILAGEVTAQRAFLHAFLSGVPRTNAIGTGHHAIFAADAFLFIDEHHIVLITIAGSSGANVHARSVFALLAHGGQRVASEIRILANWANCHNM